ncbi:hypothetical protein IX51_10430 [uncultured archaeon]|nr:hypothetical protein IX51_10430 [uncultured archaeon]
MIRMDNNMKEKLDKMLEEGEITRETYEEMKERWNDGPENPSVETAETPGQKRKSGSNSVVRISGSGSLTEVDAHELHISGSGKVSGSVHVALMKVSGAAKVDGSVYFSDSLANSGSLNVSGVIKGGALNSSGTLSSESTKVSAFISFGSAKMAGLLESESVESKGTLKASGIKCRTMDSSGIVHTETLESGKVQIHGAITASNVKADSFELESMGWGTEIKLLESDDILVTVKKRLVFPSSRVDIGEIKGGTVRIESVRCPKISAREVTIGDNCRIGYVEAEKISVSDKSIVKEKKIVGDN